MICTQKQHLEKLDSCPLKAYGDKITRPYQRALSTSLPPDVAMAKTKVHDGER